MLRQARERDAPVPERGQVRRHRLTARDVVAADDLHVGRDLVGGDDDGGQLHVDGGAQERALAALRLGQDQAVHAAVPDPAEHERRVVDAAELQAREHQARVVRRQFLLDSRQELDEPGILARVDDHADTPLAPQTEIARGPRPRVT